MIDIPKYEIIGELGRGGVAAVYKARHEHLHQYRAIKVLFDQFAEDADFVKRFMNGARNADRLKHENIVNIFDVDEKDGTHYIVMEYLEGETLKELVEREGPLPEERIYEIGGAIADALDYAHGEGVIHRDIKSANVMICNDGRVVLMDFDIAKASDRVEELTRTGDMLGTVEYMSPEQARGEQVDKKSDIYSFGVILYEMATGTLPFKYDNPLSTMEHIKVDLPDPPRKVNSSVSESLQKKILWCIDKSPENRPETLNEMFESRLEQPAPPPPPPPQPPDAGAAEPGKSKERPKKPKPKRQPRPPRKPLPPFVRKLIINLVALFILLLLVFAVIELTWYAEIHDFRLLYISYPWTSLTDLPLPREKPARSDETSRTRTKKLYREALDMLKADNISGAMNKLEEIRRYDPGNRLAYRGMQRIYNHRLRTADAAFDDGRYGTYLSIMDRAVENFPEMRLKNLYHRGRKFFGKGRYIGTDDYNAIAVYSRILREFPDESKAADGLEEAFEKAILDAFENGKFVDCTNQTFGLTKDLPALASRIYVICGDNYYSNNMPITNNMYNAAFMYTQALKADPENDYARKKLNQIIYEVINRIGASGNRGEKNQLIQILKDCLPEDPEFMERITELEK